MIDPMVRLSMFRELNEDLPTAIEEARELGYSVDVLREAAGFKTRQAVYDRMRRSEGREA